MAEMTSENKTKAPVFATALRGYARDDVDAHFAQAEKEAESLRIQVRASIQQSAALKSALASAEECLQDVQGRLDATESALNQMVGEMERVTTELESAKTARDAALARTANLDFDENSAREVLKVAQRTAEAMREQGRADATARMLAAEEHAQSVETDARRKVKALEESEQEVRKRYEEFLAAARALATTLIREVDEAKDKM